MVVRCPKCKIQLKIPDEKVAPEGTRFKCPKCQTVLLVKKPKKPAAQAKALNTKKIMVAHANPEITKQIGGLLSGAGFEVLASQDGVDTMVKILKELPHMALLDVALPKIYGFEVCRQLRDRPETRRMKLILISSTYNKDQYKRDPQSLYGNDDYLDEHHIEETLLQKVKALSVPKTAARPPAPPSRLAPAPPPPATPPPAPSAPATPAAGAVSLGTSPVDKARRLVRTILGDMHLYSAEQVDAAIKTETFASTFAAQLKEGKKIYNARVAPEVRNQTDYFADEMSKFIEKRKKALGI